MIDLQLQDTVQGADIVVNGKNVELSGGWQTMVYLALFGGNVEAVTAERAPEEIAKDWFANALLFDGEPAKQFNSRTQKALTSGAIGSNAEQVVKQAIEKDLAFVTSFANLEVEVNAKSFAELEVYIGLQEKANLENKRFQFIWNNTEQELKGLTIEEPNTTKYEDFQFTGATSGVDIISADRTEVDQLEKVTFTAVNVPDGLFYYWQIEDGSYFFYRGETIEHTFRNTGLRDVSLVVSDNFSSQTQYKEDFIEVEIGQYTEFIFDIDTTKSGATDNNEFQLPFVSNGNYSCSVDKGDGNTVVISSYNQPETLLTYSSSGVYTVKITGTFKGWSFGSTSNPVDAEKMLEVKQFGDLKLADNGGYFSGCKNLTFSNPDNLDTSYLTNFSYFFYNCHSMTTVPGMGSWDTSNVAFFNSTFERAFNFNQNINSWNVENGEGFNSCFRAASSYNSPMDQWYTPKARDFGRMFASSGFNQPIPNFDPTYVYSYGKMFKSCPFNQPVNHLVKSATKDIGDMFDGNPNFNQPVDQWDVSNVEGFRAARRVFNGAKNFAQDTSMWEWKSYNHILESFFNKTKLTRSDYDKILIGWENTPNLSNNIYFSNDLQYTKGGAAEAARNSLINNYGWTIQDGGGV